MIRSRLAAAFALLLIAGGSATAQTIDSTFLAGMRWRPIGPANMSGRITDIEGVPAPSHTYYVATAAGGIWKTSNGGTTFRPLFQTERVVSMGDIAIAPSDTSQIWAGTGEEDSRNSISPGGGIYKSNDGGLTWKLMGLEKTEHIGRIVVHPTNPDVVYVAAPGAAWRSNPERGLYKTTDGGKTWQLSKFISDKAGFVDVVMHPRNPDVLFAASWDRVRGPYFMKSGGPGSALWKTTDGGATWSEVKGGGFPATMKGRIGLAISQSNPDVIYALVEAERPQGAPDVSLAEEGRFNCHNPQAGGCGLYRSKDGGNTWEWMSGHNVRPFYYSQVRVDVANPDRVYWTSTPVRYSDDGGKTAGSTTVGLHVDHHAMWLDPNDANHMIVGNDGGIGESFDKGGTFNFINTMAVGQFYNISFDMRVPYYVCGGLQDNGSWCGPSRKASNNAPITNADWYKVGGGDGFHTAQDPRNWNLVYYESQGGNMSRVDLKTGTRMPIRGPGWNDRFRVLEDSIIIERGDTAIKPTPQVQSRLAALRARQQADSAALDLRWNWNTPFFLSQHDPDVLYAGANRVMKSTMRGENLQSISPDLSYADAQKSFVSLRTSGGITKDTTGAETYGTVVSLAESPRRAGVLYAGTDDGRVWSTMDDGKTWNEHTRAFAKLVPAGTYVSRIEPSRANDARFYISFDNHRNGDFTPYLFVTEDGGKTFRSIVSNLPRGGPDFVHVIREDPVNPNVLYAGTDVGAYVSIDRGASWQRFMNGLPTVPVHDLKVHPRDRELIAGTHGRSIWIVDVAPLQQYTPALAASAEPVLLEARPGLAYADPVQGGEGAGHQEFQATSPSFGMEISYFLRDTLPTGSKPRVFVLAANGDTLARLDAPARRGLQRVYWDMRRPAPPRVLSLAELRDSAALEPRIAFVRDSMIKAGHDERAVDRGIATWRERRGSFFGFGGGFGGGNAAPGGPLSGALGAFTDRPGETSARTRRQTRPPQGGDEPQLSPDDLRALSTVLRLTDRPSLRGQTFQFQPFVDEGEYTIVWKLGEQELRGSGRVIRSE